MKKFKCYDCGKIFDSQGTKKEYTDAIYGPCSKWIAVCPDCGEEAIEFSVNPARSAKSEQAPPCGKYNSCSCCGG